MQTADPRLLFPLAPLSLQNRVKMLQSLAYPPLHNSAPFRVPYQTSPDILT